MDDGAVVRLTSDARFYFGDNVIPMFESAIPLILEKLQDKHKDEVFIHIYQKKGIRAERLACGRMWRSPFLMRVPSRGLPHNSRSMKSLHAPRFVVREASALSQLKRETHQAVMFS